MKKSLPIAIAIAMITVVPGSIVSVSGASTACTGATDGDVFTPKRNVVEFTPSCVVIENGGTVTFENEDSDYHDPGDAGEGTQEDPDSPQCYEANDDIGTNLPPGDNYTVQLFFDTEEEELYRTNAWYNGNEIPDKFLDPGKDEVCASVDDDVWEYTSSDQDAIEITHVCHLHDGTGGSVVIEL